MERFNPLPIRPIHPRPICVKRFLQIDGKLRRIVCLSTEINDSTVTTVYALADKQNSAPSKRCVLSKQGARILDVFLAKPDTDIPAIELHRAGSGKDIGFVASLSRRISDLRAQGRHIVLSRKESAPDGKTHTWYRMITNPDLEIYQTKSK